MAARIRILQSPLHEWRCEDERVCQLGVASRYSPSAVCELRLDNVVVIIIICSQINCRLYVLVETLDVNLLLNLLPPLPPPHPLFIDRGHGLCAGKN